MLLLALFIAFIIIIFLIRTTFEVVVVDGLSMFPTYNDQDRVIILKRYRKNWLKRGKIIVSHGQGYAQFPSNTLQIKRIKAVAGDTVPLQNMTHLQMLLKDQTRLTDQREKTLTIEHNHLFICGDGLRSVDSYAYGPISIHQVKGIVIWHLTS